MEKIVLKHKEEQAKPLLQNVDAEDGGVNLVVRGAQGQRPAGGGDYHRLQGLPGVIRVDEEGRILSVLRLEQVEQDADNNQNQKAVP